MVTVHCLLMGRSGLDLCPGVWLGSKCSCHGAYRYVMSLTGTTYGMHLVSPNGWVAESNASCTVYYPDQQMQNLLILIMFYVS